MLARSVLARSVRSDSRRKLLLVVNSMALLVTFGDHSGLVPVKNTDFELPVQYPVEIGGAQTLNS